MSSDPSAIPNEEELQFSTEYADFIMANASSDRIICNGDTLLAAQEDLYMFDAFLESLNVNV